MDSIRTTEPRMARPRPNYLQALGGDGPPRVVEVDGESLVRVDLFKHDSWAATGLYRAPDSGRAVLCKFYRRQRRFGLTFDGAGRWMARHERSLLTRLSDLSSVPDLLGDVRVEGRVWRNAVARSFIPGHPLRKSEPVDDRFFPRLEAALLEIHRRGIAYVDLHKRENVVVGDDGAPYLIDFQISARLPRLWPFGAILGVLQRSDLYHLRKHWAKCRPDQCGYDSAEVQRNLPWWIKAHRVVAVPLREARRKLLVALKVRNGRGRVETEHFAEDALRSETSDSGSRPKAA